MIPLTLRRAALVLPSRPPCAAVLPFGGGAGGAACTDVALAPKVELAGAAAFDAGAT